MAPRLAQLDFRTGWNVDDWHSLLMGQPHLCGSLFSWGSLICVVYLPLWFKYLWTVVVRHLLVMSYPYFVSNPFLPCQPLVVRKFLQSKTFVLQLNMVPHFGLWFFTGMPVMPETISVSALSWCTLKGDNDLSNFCPAHVRSYKSGEEIKNHFLETKAQQQNWNQDINITI